ncbi:MAG: MFS transporter [Deltaproteobacteria bacterium]|nr:MFS transporter [Deltaproteobacteria bacterium]MBT4265004.1 MFS transporter [Deltaproteobacteria bacterium]MBT4643127.1 MFS transporter [Deltaproteobacteria bacterium]MBT6501182.1 MFS transporter [Deltaproteobacteria bacterium]MBT6615773.1 MFS transporter [Deltaproteobacteria bacterium]
MEIEEKLKRVFKYRWVIFTMLAFAYFFVYFHRLSLSVVANDLLSDFKTSASVMGLLGSMYFYCYAAMQLPSGLLSDSIGPRKVVSVSLLIAAIGSILFGFAPTIEIAFVGRIMVGLGVSVVFIPTMKILSQWYRVKEFAFMSGILNAVGGIGALGATWMLALMTGSFGWRLSFELIGVFTLLIVLLVWFFVRDKPDDMGWPSVVELDVKDGKTSKQSKQIPLLEGMKIVLKEKYFWPVAIWFFIDAGIFFGFGGLWGGPYLMDVYGLQRSEVGAILSMIAWGMIIGSPLTSFVSDKVLKSRKKTFMLYTSLLVALFIFLNIFPSGLPIGALYMIFFMLSVSASSIVVMGFTTTKELFPVEIVGTSVGSVNIFPFFGGAVFMPIMGKVLDLYPKSPDGAYSFEAYSTMLLILLATSIVALGCTFFMKETFPE